MPDIPASAEEYLHPLRYLSKTPDYLLRLTDIAIAAVAQENTPTALSALRGLKECLDKLRVKSCPGNEELHTGLEILTLQRNNAALQLKLLQILTEGDTDDERIAIEELRQYLKEANSRLDAITFASIADLDLL